MPPYPGDQGPYKGLCTPLGPVVTHMVHFKLVKFRHKPFGMFGQKRTWLSLEKHPERLVKVGAKNWATVMCVTPPVKRQPPPLVGECILHHFILSENVAEDIAGA